MSFYVNCKIIIDRKYCKTSSARSISFIGNAGYLSESRPSTGSPGCVIEGFFLVFGYPTSWLWTLYLTFTIYSLVTWESVPDNYFRGHLLCWGLPLSLAIFQFAAGGYGGRESNRFDICGAHQSEKSSTTYHLVTFYGLLLVVIVLMLLMRGKLFFLHQKEDPRTLSPLFVVLQQILDLYPMLLLVCWVPRSIILFVHHVPTPVKVFSISLKIIHGVLMAIAYFYQSASGRAMLWKSLSPSFWLNLNNSGNSGRFQIIQTFLWES